MTDEAPRRTASLDAYEQRERTLEALERIADALERLTKSGRLEVK